eukprot:180807-Alexandrium_andersonii.AAC.1
MRDVQHWAHEGAGDSAKVSVDSARLTRAARGCRLRAAEAVEPGKLVDGCDWSPGDAMEKASAWQVCRSFCSEAVRGGLLQSGLEPSRK